MDKPFCLLNIEIIEDTALRDYYARYSNLHLQVRTGSWSNVTIWAKALFK